ncbi:MAG: phosphotransferase [Gammaproteobacteria bacterium]|nr:phosphotransferase [Gammaproteobacteria bacterium]
MDLRIELIHEWLRRDLGWVPARLESASADASFRRYFRVWNAAGATRIVMDAPPDREDIAPYLKVARLLATCDVHVPRIDAADPARGLVLLEDLGSTHMLAALQGGADAGELYAAALAPLTRIQLRGLEAARELPAYDRAVLEREMALCPEWFCRRHLGLLPDSADCELLAATCELLVREALAQPVVFVHRDYHSRNLMCLARGGPGILDFQDALAGPIGYDLVSLLKDCYIAWPRVRVEQWVEQYRRGIGALAGGAGRDEFLRWFDLIGLQRHIKVLGIFARLWHRDGKPGYLGDLPRTLDYVRDTAGRYTELREFSAWVERRLVPGLAAANARALAGTAP